MINLNEAQAIQQWWEGKMGIDERDKLDRFNRMLEEVDELHEAIEGNASCKDVALEAVDVFIFCLSIISRCGYDLGGLFVEKMERNHYKYNVDEVQRLREEGLPLDNILQTMKERWEDETI